MPSRNFEDEPMNRRRAPDADLSGYDDEISLKPVFRALWVYRRTVAAAVSGLLIVFVLGALYSYLRQPTERQASLEFRLVFDGADRNQYPNGLPFTRSEIIASPILTQVYETNEVSRYGTYQDFKNAIFILESSPDLELLTSEYQAKLADSRLTPVDRSRIEEEFRQKRDALRVPQYTLNFMSSSAGANIPGPLMNKVLNDILATWAEEAAERKGVLKYQMAVLTPNVLQEDFIGGEDYLVRLDILRDKINRIIQNIDGLMDLPGATVMRVGEANVSLPEIRANLEDIQRFRLQPLLGVIRTTGLSRDPDLLRRYIEDRLFQIRLEKQEAEARVRVLEQGLARYMADRPPVSGSAAPQSTPAAPAAPAPPFGTPALIPQLGDSFLDRLVAMSTEHGDAQYRQQITDRIIGAGQATVDLETESIYYEELMRSVRQLATNGSRGGIAPVDRRTQEMVDARFDEIYAAVVQLLEQANSIYSELSLRNLTPRTNLYTITGPFSVTTQRALTLGTLGLYGLLTMMVGVILVPLACLVHHYFRSEILPGEQARSERREARADAGAEVAAHGPPEGGPHDPYTRVRSGLPGERERRPAGGPRDPLPVTLSAGQGERERGR